MSKPLFNLLSEAFSMLGFRHRDSGLADLNEKLRAAAENHRALEIATAKAMQADRRESERLAGIERDIADLEARAVQALRGDDNAIAARASAVLADLEHQHSLQAKIAREARGTLHHLEMMFAANKLRLRRLQHGCAVAELRTFAPRGVDGSPLDQAEDLLGVMDAQYRLNGGEAKALADELGQAGFGASPESEAEAIMLKLQQRAGRLDSPSNLPNPRLTVHDEA